VNVALVMKLERDKNKLTESKWKGFKFRVIFSILLLSEISELFKRLKISKALVYRVIPGSPTIHLHTIHWNHDSLTPRFTDKRFTDNTKSVGIHILGPAPITKSVWLRILGPAPIQKV
jgi:hypothetical protein